MAKARSSGVPRERASRSASREEPAPNSRRTIDVDPAWLESDKGEHAARKSIAGRVSRPSLTGRPSEDRRTMDVKEEWLEPPVAPPPLPPAKARSGKKVAPPPLPDDGGEDETPSRSAIPPPLPKPAPRDWLATVSGLKRKKTRKPVT